MPENVDETTAADETEGVALEATPAEDATDTEQVTDDGDQGDTFPREVVEKLRQENGKYRQRAQRADDLAAALWQTRVEATGKLADATDLPMPEGADPLNAETVTAAVDELLAAKPHLASRRPIGDVGQGSRGTAEPFSLLGALQERT